MGQERSSFKTINHNHLLTINVNEHLFFRSRMGQTKQKPLRTIDFLRLTAKNCSLHLERIFILNQLQEIEHYFVHQIFKY